MTKDEQIVQLRAALEGAREGLKKISYPHLHFSPINDAGFPYDTVTLSRVQKVAKESLSAIDAVMGDMEGTGVCAESHGKRPFESDTPPPTTSQSDECRMAFEEWRDTLSVKYAPAIEACMLASWQASRATPEPQPICSECGKPITGITVSGDAKFALGCPRCGKDKEPQPPMELVELVSRAMCVARRIDPDEVFSDQVSFDPPMSVSHSLWMEFRSDAQAALSVIMPDLVKVGKGLEATKRMHVYPAGSMPYCVARDERDEALAALDKMGVK